MNRLAKALGKFAVAAGAATALLISAPDSAQPQVTRIPPRDAQKIVVPGARNDPIVIKKADRADVIVKLGPVLVPVVNREPMLKQLRPIFEIELRLLTSAAGPTPSERREIALEAGRTLKTARLNALNNDPRKLVRTHLELAAWSKLSNVQSARYRSELDRKALARREVVVLNVVATLEKHLCLDAGQREKLCETLRSSWDDRDYLPSETFSDYDVYVPLVPDLIIVPILTEVQLKIWRSLRKTHFASIRGINPVKNVLPIGVEDNEEEAEDEDVKAALAEEPKK